MGFHPVIFFTVNQVAVLFQFWSHTEYIGRLHPAIEYLFATPSNHRVHHGSQKKYINKNYGATFMIWDRMFNTYQKEEEKVKYGVTQNIQNKANPFHINFHELSEIWHDIRSARTWRLRLFYLFGDPIAIHEKKTALSKARMKGAAGLDFNIVKKKRPLEIDAASIKSCTLKKMWHQDY